MNVTFQIYFVDDNPQWGQLTNINLVLLILAEFFVCLTQNVLTSVESSFSQHGLTSVAVALLMSTMVVLISSMVISSLDAVVRIPLPSCSNSSSFSQYGLTSVAVALVMSTMVGLIYSMVITSSLDASVRITLPPCSTTFSAQIRR